MIRVQKRNDRFHIDCQIGKLRVRGALGTQDKTVASRLKSRIELAIAEGARSENWIDLRKSLPETTYSRFAKATGLKIEMAPTWRNLVSIFWTHVQAKKLSKGTHTRYEYAVEAFDYYLGADDTLLDDITPHVMDEYKIERHEQILARPNSRNGNGLAAEISVLRSMFQLAVDRHMMDKNPVRKGHTKAEYEVNPFTKEELFALKGACQSPEEWLVYTLLRYTGLRVSDAADLRWEHVQKMEIVKRTLKRGVIVHIPLARPLAAIFNEIAPLDQAGHVIEIKNKSVSTAQIRQILRLIGSRAGVPNTRPHRFRHSLAVDLLLKGASVYEVSKILGDSVATVEKHYAKFLPAMREKVKGLLDDTSKGLEA